MSTSWQSLPDWTVVPVAPAAPLSEEEFVAWCREDVRAEWNDGEVILMSPSSTEHARLVPWLDRVVSAFVRHHRLGESFTCEPAVRLPKARQRCHPDIFFIAAGRESIILTNHIEGSPDLVMEVVSPESFSRDWRDKFDLYQKAGVREYWVIDPQARHVEAYTLGAQGRYVRIAEAEGKLSSAVIPGLWFLTTWFWPETRPSELEALRELGVRN